MAKEIWVDTETTGTDPLKHGLIQLSGIVVIDNIEKERFDWFIRPFEGDVIEEQALERNGIKKEDFSDFREPRGAFIDFINLLNRYVDKYDKKDKFHFIAYNARFDDDFLRAFFRKNVNLYYGAYFFFPPLDVMDKAAWEFKEIRASLPNFQLGTIAKFLKIEIDENRLHDALYDIETTMNVYKRLQEIKQ